jgi:hypothetical protein
MAPVRQTSREISVLWSCLQRELVGALRRNALRTQVSFITAAFLVVIAPDERTDSTAFPTIFLSLHLQKSAVVRDVNCCHQDNALIEPSLCGGDGRWFVSFL